MKTYLKIIIAFLFIFSCTKDEVLEQYKLTTTVSPAEGGSISPASGTFDEGSLITLTATASNGYRFENWSGAIAGTSNPASVTINSDINVTAVFENIDADDDGVVDDLDQCPETPAGVMVDSSGCALSQLDTDSDGIADDLDQCPNTLPGESIDSYGCSIDLQTYIPDDYFEQLLISQGIDTDGVINQHVRTSDISGISSLILMGTFNGALSDMTGIEDFVSLEMLTINFATFSTIDLSQNSALRILDISFAPLTSLDVSQNTALEVLLYFGNQLTELNLSQNTSLRKLYCSYSQLKSLDVSQNIALTELNCSNNQLSTLNVKNGNNTTLQIFEAQNNPDLTCIQVDNVAYAMTNWTDIDPGATFSLDCGY